jgi:hypothetical protein
MKGQIKQGVHRHTYFYRRLPAKKAATLLRANLFLMNIF